METEELIVLSRKYLAGAANDAEKARLLRWYNAYDEAELTAFLEAEDHETEASLEARMLRRLQQATGTAPRVHLLRRKTTWAAAAVLLAAVAGGAFLWHSAGVSADVKAIAQQTPGNKAVLIMDDGRQVQLDKDHGSLPRGAVMKDSATIAYTQAQSSSVHQNTLKTPRGGQFKLILPDGTGVWLNAESSITYPTAFTGGQRNVSITGEVYFEVAQNAQQSFTVAANKAAIQVLGTSFNVNAYEDEQAVLTTLLEGAVNVNSTRLHPGQQATVTGNKVQVTDVNDIQSVIAWKNGFFSFKDADVPTIMHQLERWYDVKVNYAGAIPEGRFTGELERTLSLQQVAALLAAARIHLQVEEGGRSVTVLP